MLWQLSWRLRILLLLAVFVVLGAGGADRSGELSTSTARIAAAGVLVVGAALAWWTTRRLPSGTWPVMRAALAADGPLAGTWVALGLCVALYATVVITGVAVLVAGVWFVLLGLAVLAVAVGVAAADAELTPDTTNRGGSMDPPRFTTAALRGGAAGGALRRRSGYRSVAVQVVVQEVAAVRQVRDVVARDRRLRDDVGQQRLAR